MNFTTTLSAVLVGYFAGSISFARLITRLASPQRDVEQIVLKVPDSDIRVVSDSVSATTVRLQVGPRYGLLVSVLDMVKAAGPALFFKLVFPGTYLYLVSAGMATVGHIWPIYHRFHGGRGASTVLGAFWVVDWLGVLVTNLLGFLLGLPSRNMLIITGAGMVLMIPWLLVRSQDWVLVLFAVAVNLLYWTAMIPELRQYVRLQREGGLEAFSDARELRVIRADGTETIDRATLGNLLSKFTLRRK